MSFKDQIINLIIQGRDLFSSEAKKSELALSRLGSESEKLSQKLQSLEQQQQSIARFKELSKAVEEGTQRYKSAAAAAQALAAEQKAAAADVRQLERSVRDANTQLAAQQAAQAKAKAEVDAYEKQITETRNAVARLSAELKSNANASAEQTRELAEAQAKLNALEQAQRNAKGAVEQFNSAISQQQSALKASQAELANANGKLVDHQVKVKEAKDEVSSLGKELSKNRNELKQHSQVLEEAGVALDKMDDAAARLNQEQAEAERRLEKVNEELKKHERLLSESSKSANDYGGSIKGAASSLALMAGTYLGIDRLWQSLSSVLESGDKAQAFSTQMAALMGSLTEGEKAVAWMKDFANNTGTRLDSVKQAFVSLKTFGLDPMSGAMQSLVDYNARLGGGQERLEGIVLAVGQAWAKQKLQGEEILQLVERGVPVWDMLAKVTGKNTVELQKMSEAGQLGRDTISALLNEMGQTANGQASKSLNTLAGQVNVLSNQWEKFKQTIADSGVYQTAISAIKEINAAFEKAANDGTLLKLSQDVSNFFTQLVSNGGAAIRTTLENISALNRGLNVIAGSIRLATNGFSAGISIIAQVVIGFVAKMQLAWSQLLRTVGADEIAKEAREAADALKAISEGFSQQVAQDGRDIKAAWQQITGETEAALQKSYEKITQTTQQATQAQAEAITQVTTAEKARAAAADELSVVMSKAGITTIASLKEQEQAAKKTYEQVAEAAKAGVLTSFEVRQGYEKWAEASLKLAAAQNQAVPETLKAEAAAKGLSNTLRDLISKNEMLKESQSSTSEFQASYVNQLNQTAGTIARLKDTINSATTSTEEKTLASKQLANAERDLKVQTEELSKVKAMEAQTYSQLVQQYRILQDEMGRLDQMFQNGSIAADAYNEQKRVLAQRLQVVTSLLGNYVEAQRKSAGATDATTSSLRAQNEKWDGIAKATGRAIQYNNLYAASQQNAVTASSAAGMSTLDLTEKYKRLNKEMMDANSLTGAFWGTWGRMQAQGYAAQMAIIDQTLRFRQLNEELQSTGLSLNRLTYLQKAAQYGFDQLDSASLKTLEESISAAHRRLQSMRDDIAGTVSDLRRELMELRGEKEQLESYDQEQRKLALQQKLAAAQASGDQAAVASAEEALRLLSEITKEKQRQRQLEKQSEAASTKSNNSRTDTPFNPGDTKKPEEPGGPIKPPKSTPTTDSNATALGVPVLVLQAGDVKAKMYGDREMVSQLLQQIERARGLGL